ncbi:guanine nucleotide-binding protein subunit gamma 2-like [Aristolochia californica]|uniref:guanine nucleotide-binding protein subunit gamma 2-like n=1 Tax=Aristolochia californica TaxID=171875 RepID=UPI0035D8E055
MTEEGLEPPVRGERQEAALPPLSGPDVFIGKHRMAAAIARLQQEIQSIEEELNQLETMPASSVVCEETVASVENRPDALLPLTQGPANPAWDRWFQGAQSSRNHKWWTQKRSD